MVWDQKHFIDIAAIAYAAKTLAPDSTCADARDRFAADATLRAIPVLDGNGAPVGIVYRHPFLLALLQGSSKAIDAKRPIATLMDRRPTVLERQLEVSQLCKRALADERDPAITSCIVVDKGRYVGIAGFGGLLRVVTDHLRKLTLNAEQAEHEADAAAEEKSRFLANITHELRTPLNGVIGFGQLLQRKPHGPLGAAEYKLYVTDIVDSGLHLLDIINDILDLSKIEAGHLNLDESFIDLRELAGRSLRMVATLAAQKDIKLASSVSGPKWTVRADERRLRQSLVNLLSNAIKFSSTGQQVAIGLGFDDDWLWLEVRDQGCGIADSDLHRLFKPFSQIQSAQHKAETGTGLGLTITSALMQAHDGEVTLDSQLGVGTRARLKLPKRRLLAEEFAWSPHDKIELIDPQEAAAD